MIKVLISDFSKVILFPNDDAYQGSLDELFKSAYGKTTHNFFDLYAINQELLDIYLTVKRKYKLQACIFTTGTVQKHPELRPFLQPVFDQIFSVTDLRIEKTDPNAYIVLARELRVKPSEILFIDDQEANFQAAVDAGVNGIHFQSNDQLKLSMKRYLSQA